MERPWEKATWRLVCGDDKQRVSVLPEAGEARKGPSPRFQGDRGPADALTGDAHL